MQASISRAALALGLVLLALPATAADFTETKTFTSDQLTLTNLIGEIAVSGHDGSGFEVVVHVRGADASPAGVRLETAGDRLTVVFPDSKRYVYPNLANDHKVSFSPDGGSGGWLAALLGSDRIEVTRSGKGLEVWADIEVRVPSGGNLRLRQGVGAIGAKDVNGDLDLDSHYGTVTVNSVDGDLLVDTGSGDVSIADTNGEVNVDTGSGDVWLTAVVSTGDVSVDTGSGDVTLTDVSGNDIDVDTGSGDVKAAGIRAENALIDTGSGAVVLNLSEMGRGDFDIDTGSGAIQLGLPTGANCRVQAESGSGGVSVDVAGVKDMRRDEDGNEVAFTVGDGGASVRLDAGSGRIRIVEAR